MSRLPIDLKCLITKLVMFSFKFLFVNRMITEVLNLLQSDSKSVSQLSQ